MKFLASLALLGLFSWGTQAAPAPDGWDGWKKGCLSRDYVQSLVDREIIFLQHRDIAAARAAAFSIFDPNIQEYGDSINSLRGDPLGTLVEDGRETYVTDTLSAPGVGQIDTLAIVVDCDTFVWQWRFFGIGPPTAPNPYIQGFTLAKVNSAGLIYYQYVEFNSLAWAENSGFTVEPPTTGPFAPPS